MYHPIRTLFVALSFRLASPTLKARPMGQIKVVGPGYSMWTPGLEACVTFCDSSDQCDAINYHSSSHKCRLFTPCTHVYSTYASSDYYFYSKRPQIVDHGYVFDKERDSCVKLMETDSDMSQGDRVCTKQNGRLLSLSGPSTMDLAVKLMIRARARPQYVWTGAEDPWDWKSDFTRSKFYPSSSDGLDASGHLCSVLEITGQWHRVPCNHSRYMSLCEVPAFYTLFQFGTLQTTPFYNDLPPPSSYPTVSFPSYDAITPPTFPSYYDPFRTSSRPESYPPFGDLVPPGAPYPPSYYPPYGFIPSFPTLYPQPHDGHSRPSFPTQAPWTYPGYPNYNTLQPPAEKVPTQNFPPPQVPFTTPYVPIPAGNIPSYNPAPQPPQNYPSYSPPPQPPQNYPSYTPPPQNYPHYNPPTQPPSNYPSTQSPANNPPYTPPPQPSTPPNIPSTATYPLGSYPTPPVHYPIPPSPPPTSTYPRSPPITVPPSIASTYSTPPPTYGPPQVPQAPFPPNTSTPFPYYTTTRPHVYFVPQTPKEVPQAPKDVPLPPFFGYPTTSFGLSSTTTSYPNTYDKSYPNPPHYPATYPSTVFSHNPYQPPQPPYRPNYVPPYHPPNQVSFNQRPIPPNSPCYNCKPPNQVPLKPNPVPCHDCTITSPPLTVSTFPPAIDPYFPPLLIYQPGYQGLPPQGIPTPHYKGYVPPAAHPTNIPYHPITQFSDKPPFQGKTFIVKGDQAYEIPTLQNHHSVWDRGYSINDRSLDGSGTNNDLQNKTEIARNLSFSNSQTLGPNHYTSQTLGPNQNINANPSNSRNTNDTKVYYSLNNYPGNKLKSPDSSTNKVQDEAVQNSIANEKTKHNTTTVYNRNSTFTSNIEYMRNGKAPSRAIIEIQRGGSVSKIVPKSSDT